jgi:hypothetical protein
MPRINGRYVHDSHASAIAHRIKFPELYETVEEEKLPIPGKKVRAKKKRAETAAIEPRAIETADEI